MRNDFFESLDSVRFKCRTNQWKGYAMGYKINKRDEEWKKQLTPQQYDVTRKKSTERAFTGEYYDSKAKGLYVCVCCGAII